MAVTSRIEARIQAILTSALDLGTASVPFVTSLSLDWESGTGANQADLVFADTRTIAASGNEDLDLAASLVSGLGATLTFVKLKLLFIKAAAANTNNVVLTRPANGVPLFSAAADAHAIKPGGWIMMGAPAAAGICTVTADTGDLINISNSGAGTGVTYDVIIVGTSA